MPNAFTTTDGAERFASLDGLGILDSKPQPEFDAIVRAAALVCDVPISVISLSDTKRNWLKANVGFPNAGESPRESSFASYAAESDDLLEIADATQDVRFAQNRHVLGPPSIRFYAGAPISVAGGRHVGTLCVIDCVSRTLNDVQRGVLAALAAAASALLESWALRERLARTMQALEGSEERVRRLYEATPAILQSMSPEGRLVTVSNAWLARFGYERAEVIGRNAWDFAIADDAEATRVAILATFRKDTAYGGINFRAVARSGEVIDIALSGIVERDLNGAPLHGLALLNDVTFEKKTVDLLNRTGTLSKMGGWELDLRTGELVWTDETYRIFGVTPEYVPTLDAAIDFYEGDGRARIRAALSTAIREGVPWDLELPVRRADGHHIWVHTTGVVTAADGKPIRLMGSLQDVTDRIQERVALERANVRVTLATESGGVGIWEWDIASDTLTWDSSVCRLYGVDAASMPGSFAVWQTYWHADDAPTVKRAVERALVEQRTFTAECRIVRSDGHVRYVRSSADIARDEAGHAIRMVGTMWDTTESRLLAQQLADHHEILRVTLQSIGDAVITTNANGRIEWLNPAAEGMTGWSAAHARGRPHTEVFRTLHQHTRAATLDPISECLRHGRSVELAKNTVLISRSGREVGIEDSTSPIRNDDGELIGVVLVFHDVTEARRLAGEMEYRASHDKLTGLVNREEFEARLRRVLRESHTGSTVNALLYIDLDQFKIVNDSCGHAVGDLFLVQVANLLSTIVRDRDTLARLGGDEFAVILEHCTAEEALRSAQQICDDLGSFRFSHEGKRFRIGASIGLVPVDRRWPTTAAILQVADTACYAAKEAGRGRVHTWSDSALAMRARVGDMLWATRLEQALDDDGFVLYGQRIAALRAHERAIRAEILVRMIDTDGSLILPGAFLPAAERFNLASRIDRWVVRRVIDWMKRLPSLDALGCICVNLSGQSVGDTAFHAWAMTELATAGTDICRRLCFEITETAAITNLADAAAFVTQVHGSGVRVALDDFGAGASSFAYLKKLKVDSLKIDGQFIRNAVADPIDEVAVRCFIDLAKAVGLESVAEMVENEQVLQHLTRAGADFAQGFVIHRPSPIGQLLTD